MAMTIGDIQKIKDADGNQLAFRAWLLMERNFRDAGKGGKSILNHSWEVAATLHDLMNVRDPEILAAALVHDALEAGPGGIGNQIKKQVSGLAEQRAWMLTNESRFYQSFQFDQRLRNILKSRDKGVKMIAVADRRDGLRTMTEHLLQSGKLPELQRYVNQSKLICDALSCQKAPGIDLLKAEINSSLDKLAALRND